MGKPLSKELLVFLILAVLAVGYVVMDVNSVQTSNDVAGQGYKARCLKTLELNDNNWLSIGDELIVKTIGETYTIKLFEVKQGFTEGNPNISSAKLSINGGEEFWVMEGESIDYPHLVFTIHKINQLSSESQNFNVINIRYIVPLVDPLKRSCNAKLKHGNQWLSKNEQIVFKPYGSTHVITFLKTKKIKTESGEFELPLLDLNGKQKAAMSVNDMYVPEPFDLFFIIKDIKKVNTPTKQTDVVLLDYVYVQ
ncbi:hypothetical protein HYY69_07815 [Candidatus Woesearchaeota archaeon]|nr:hypothetical protein [Candidatus Woesearchaeota archaeon]